MERFGELEFSDALWKFHQTWRNWYRNAPWVILKFFPFLEHDFDKFVGFNLKEEVRESVRDLMEKEGEAREPREREGI